MKSFILTFLTSNSLLENINNKIWLRSVEVSLSPLHDETLTEAAGQSVCRGSPQDDSCGSTQDSGEGEVGPDI